MFHVPFSIPTEPFVGRDAELAQLHQAWHTAVGQGGAIVLIEAEAGGGKTRLAQEFGRSLPGALFLTGQCYELTRTAPYRPWIDILQVRLAQVDDANLAHLSPYWLDQLTRLLPELAALRRASRNICGRRSLRRFCACPAQVGGLWTGT